MKEIIFATTNYAKIEEMDRVLTPIGMKVIHANIEISEPYGNGLEFIARAKVINAFQQFKKPAAALDTGFFIKALDGYPGDHIGHALTHLGLEGMIKSVEGKDRSCHYENCLAYFDGTSEDAIFFHSDLHGRLSFQIKGIENPPWCPIHRIFIPNGEDRTLAEIAESEEEYIKWRNIRYPKSTSYKFVNWLLKNMNI